MKSIQLLLLITLLLIISTPATYSETYFTGKISNANVQTDINSNTTTAAQGNLDNQRKSLNVRAVGASGILTLSDTETLDITTQINTTTFPFTIALQSGFSAVSQQGYESYASRFSYLGHQLDCDASMSTKKRPPTTNVTASGHGRFEIGYISKTIPVRTDSSPYSDYLQRNPATNNVSIGISGPFTGIEYTHLHPLSLEAPLKYNNLINNELDMDRNLGQSPLEDPQGALCPETHQVWR